MNSLAKRFSNQYTITHMAMTMVALICLAIVVATAVTPNFGFLFDTTSDGWIVTELCASCGSELSIGDTVVSINGIVATEVNRNDNLSLILHPGTVVSIEKSGGEIVSWEIPQLDAVTVVSRALIALFVFPFWFCGALVAHIVADSPKRNHFVFLMLGYSLWFAAGLAGPTFLRTTLILRGLSWILAVAAIHFHWLYPAPELHHIRWWPIYLAASLISLADVSGLLFDQSHLVPTLLQIAIRVLPIFVRNCAIGTG